MDCSTLRSTDLTQHSNKTDDNEMSRVPTANLICKRYILSEKQLSEAFDMLDIDKNGCLSRNELAVLLRTMKVEPTRDEVDFIFNELDVDKAGSIKKDTFIKYMISPVIQTMPLCQLESLFVKFDTDGDGAITEDEMIELLREVNDCRDTKPPHELFLEHDGRITFLEFINFIQG